MAQPRDRKKRATWFQLDNAALLYSAIQREDYSALYRFSVTLKEPVRPETLQRAIDRTMPRFPSFRVRIRHGLFWHYLEPNERPGPFLMEDIANPCQPVRYREDNGWLIRFFYHENRISIEVFHAVADGLGTLVLLSTLLAVYLRELGHEIPNGGTVLNVDEPPRPEEWEDAYLRYALPQTGWKLKRETAYAGLGTRAPFYTLNLVRGLLPLDKVKERAKAYGASVTEYLAAVLIWSLIQKQRAETGGRGMRPVALAVPLNLRAPFPSATLRNFVLNVRPCIDPALRDYAFSEVVSLVHHQMRLQSDPGLLQARITRNVKFQKNGLIRLIPLCIKNPVLHQVYKRVGSKPFTTTFTNPGVFPMPDALRAHLLHAEAILGQAFDARSNCAALSLGDTLTICFAATVHEVDVEREFFRFLVRDGIPVSIDSNRTPSDNEVK